MQRLRTILITSFWVFSSLAILLRYGADWVGRSTFVEDAEGLLSKILTAWWWVEPMITTDTLLWAIFFVCSIGLISIYVGEHRFRRMVRWIGLGTERHKDEKLADELIELANALLGEHASIQCMRMEMHWKTETDEDWITLRIAEANELESRLDKRIQYALEQFRVRPVKLIIPEAMLYHDLPATARLLMRVAEALRRGDYHGNTFRFYERD